MDKIYILFQNYFFDEISKYFWVSPFEANWIKRDVSNLKFVEDIM